jgi:hypothetical protein
MQYISGDMRQEETVAHLKKCFTKFLGCKNIHETLELNFSIHSQDSNRGDTVYRMYVRVFVMAVRLFFFAKLIIEIISRFSSGVSIM